MEIEQKSINLNIKWGKESLTVDINNGEDLDSLRGRLYSVTLVQPDKQKLMFKGKFLKEGGVLLKDLGLTEVSLLEFADYADGTAGNASAWYPAESGAECWEAGLL
jgi:hypothetical protein